MLDSTGSGALKTRNTKAFHDGARNLLCRSGAIVLYKVVLADGDTAKVAIMMSDGDPAIQIQIFLISSSDVESPFPFLWSIPVHGTVCSYLWYCSLAQRNGS
jgi:hypothetical protein